MRVLLIEDEKKAAEYLKIGLSQSGYVVTIAADGKEGLFYATEQHYDIIILDIMLPKMDGWTVLTKIRECDKQTPIIVLTARDALDDRVHGLNLGGDDYLIKPFAFSELLARVQALLRRGNKQQEEEIRIADLKINLLTHKVYRNGKKIELSPKEFALLALLMKRQGQILSRTLIAEQVWDINFDSDTNVIDVSIKRLRDKIGDTEENKLIHTVRGLGYILENKQDQ